MNKRSNITIFILLGTIILLSVYFFIFINKSTVEAESMEVVEESIREADLFLPIENYIESHIINGYHYGLSDAITKINGTCTLPIEECGIRRGGYGAQPDPYPDDTVPIPTKYTYGLYAFREDMIDTVEDDIEWFVENHLRNISYKIFEDKGFEFIVGSDIESSFEINDDFVIIDVNYSLEIRHEDKVTKIDYLHYKVNDRLGNFLNYVKNTIANKENNSEIYNLSYNMVEEITYEVNRVEGLGGEYDIITITDESIKLFNGYLSVGFVRENRPPDANTVYLSSGTNFVPTHEFFENIVNGSVLNFTSVNYTMLFSNLTLNYTTEEREVDYVYYGNELTLNCPNYKNDLSSYTDPDEDDRYSYVTYNFDMEGHDYSICGNNEKKFTALLSADGCDVGTDLKVTLTDSGGLTDEKYFENVIRCGPDDKNGCCGLNGEWMDGEVGGCGYIHCPWLTVETCTYTRCAGSCGSENEISLIAVTKEQQFIDECNECGDCVCSNSEEPRFRTFACPASESCPECSESPEPESGPCFIKGTKITMFDGTKKNIEDVNVGDFVLSYDEKLNKNVINKVTKLFVHKNIEGHLIINHKLKVTPNHRVMLNGKWQQLYNVKIGDILIDLNGNDVRINSIVKINTINTVYNFEVEDTHIYYAENILVHNTKD